MRTAAFFLALASTSFFTGKEERATSLAQLDFQTQNGTIHDDLIILEISRNSNTQMFDRRSCFCPSLARVASLRKSGVDMKGLTILVHPFSWHSWVSINPTVESACAIWHTPSGRCLKQSWNPGEKPGHSPELPMPLSAPWWHNRWGLSDRLHRLYRKIVRRRFSSTRQHLRSLETIRKDYGGLELHYFRKTRDHHDFHNMSFCSRCFACGLVYLESECLRVSSCRFAR